METTQQKSYNLNSKVEDIDITPKAKRILLKNNIFNLNSLTDLTRKEIKAFKGMGGLDLASIELFVKKVGLILKKEEKKPKEKDPFLDQKKKLILKLLKNTENVNWSGEIKAANVLFKQNPNPEFWDKFTLPFKLNSLYFLLSTKGKEFIFDAKKEKKEITTFEKTDITLSETIVGDNIISTKPKSIKDFLNGK